MPHTPHTLAMEEAPERARRLVQRHAHDVRNQLNSLDLELLLLGELASEPATLECVARLRAHLAALEVQVKSLVGKFVEPEPIVLAAEDLLRLWKGQTAPLLGPGREITWAIDSPPASVRLDARSLVAALTELTVAAWSRAGGRPLTAALAATDEAVSVELREPGQVSALAADLIWELERLVTANGGRLEHGAAGEAFTWVTTLTFPVTTGG